MTSRAQSGPRSATRGTKRPVRTGLRVRAYAVMSDAVELGTATGYRRAHKHTDAPDRDLLCGAIHDAVLAEICDKFDFDEED